MISTATYNPILSTTANQFVANQSQYVGKILFPTFNTAKKSSDYPVFDRSNMLDMVDKLERAPGSAYGRSQAKMSDDTYNCKEYGHEAPVDDSIKANYASAFDADVAEVTRVQNIIMFGHEKRCHALATSAAIANSTPATKWNVGTATPIKDVQLALNTIQDNCGLAGNIMVINRDTYQILKEHPTIVDRIKYTYGRSVTDELLSNLLGVRIVVAGALHNSANEGQALTVADLWNDDVIIARVDSSQNLSMPSFGRTFSWNEGGVGTVVESYRDDTVRGDVHRVFEHTDEKIVGAQCGYRLGDVLA